jgi:hypothetical protein
MTALRPAWVSIWVTRHQNATGSENRRVGGSIAPLGTATANTFRRERDTLILEGHCSGIGGNGKGPPACGMPPRLLANRAQSPI